MHRLPEHSAQPWEYRLPACLVIGGRQSFVGGIKQKPVVVMLLLTGLWPSLLQLLIGSSIWQTARQNSSHADGCMSFQSSCSRQAATTCCMPDAPYEAASRPPVFAEERFNHLCVGATLLCRGWHCTGPATRLCMQLCKGNALYCFTPQNRGKQVHQLHTEASGCMCSSMLMQSSVRPESCVCCSRDPCLHLRVLEWKVGPT